MTTNKTFAAFLSNFSSNPELHRKLWKLGGVSWEDFSERPTDYFDPSGGSVPGCIYYDDTVKFAKQNHFEILKEIKKYDEDGGGSSLIQMPTDDETQFYNWLTWFGWELLASELAYYVES